MFQVGDLVEWSLPLAEDRPRPIGIVAELVDNSTPGREPGFLVEWFGLLDAGSSYEFAYCLRVVSGVREGE